MSLKEYLKGSIDEMRKATWPSKDEVVRVTICVLIFVFVFAGVLFSIDFIAQIFFRGFFQ
ncbi:MAG: preprotein translocase subunit SecE [Brevinema sp.]